MADVSVVVVTLDGEPWIASCLESVLGAAREVIVVDHGSSDGTVALVRERFPQVRVLEQGQLLRSELAATIGRLRGPWGAERLALPPRVTYPGTRPVTCASR